MAKLTVNIGTSANDRTGDNLRTAFNKINENFDELYTALGLDDNSLNLGAFEFTGSVMTTTDSSAITIDQAVTVSSDLTVGGDVVPSTDLGSSLGSATKRFKDLYISNNTIFLGNTSLGVSSGGDLTVGGASVSSVIDYNDIQNKPTLFDGAYSSLSGKPTIPTDVSELADATNILFDGAYSSLSGKPTIPADVGDLTDTGGLLNGVDLTAFSVGSEASASGDGGIAYDNSTGVFTYTPPDLSGYQATLVSGTNIKTLNYGSLLGSGNINIEPYADYKVNLLLGTDPTLAPVPSGYILSYDDSQPIQKYQWIPQSSGGADLSAVDENYAPDTDNAYDLGIAAGNFLRTGYFKTSVVIDNATLTYNADGQLQSSAGINTSALYSNSYMSIEPQYGGLIFWMDGDAGGGTLGYSANNGSNEMTWSGDMYSNGPTYQLDNDQANLQIGAEVTKTISGVTLGATTSLNFSDPYYANPNSTVTITGVVGTTELNNQTYYINSSNELFTDAGFTTPLNSSAFTAYVSGGTAVVAPRATASLPVLHSAPATPKSGMMAVADGTNWNPTGTGTETMVVYLGGAWRTIANE